MVKIGIIGGSGLDDPKILKDSKELDVDTEFGKPSDKITVGKISGVDVALLPRHGKRHTITPTHVNNKANIAALKKIGCTHIIATTACGSLRNEICRGDFVILDQFIDFTRLRKITFFDTFPGGGENANHTSMPEPFDENLRNVLIEASKELKIKHHEKGTVITIEGTRFSTRAESHMFRVWGADVINMSVAPECILANEAKIPYAAIAMSTDYDSWKKDEVPVTWAEILDTFHKNVDKVISLIVKAVPKIK